MTGQLTSQFDGSTWQHDASEPDVNVAGGFYHDGPGTTPTCKTVSIIEDEFGVEAVCSCGAKFVESR